LFPLIGPLPVSSQRRAILCVLTHNIGDPRQMTTGENSLAGFKIIPMQGQAFLLPSPLL
jgi:hypothetical protein